MNLSFPLVFRYLARPRDKSANTPEHMIKYISALKLSMRNLIYIITGRATKAMEPNMAMNELNPCFTATVSLTQSNLGNFKLIATPKKAVNTVTVIGKIYTSNLLIKVKSNIKLHTVEAINSGGMQITICI